MEQSFAEFLSTKQADRDTIQQAARYYLAELTDDLDPEDMKQEMVEEAQDPGQVEPLLRTLEQDTASVEEASLLLLSAAWEDPNERERVKRAIEGAKRKLPVISTAILAIVAMYGMYLLATGGVKTSEKTSTRKADGSIETKEKKVYASPTEPLRAIVDLFPGGLLGR
jgi:hypothetical protein